MDQPRGESFGAPTDPEANPTNFQYVVGTRRNDTVPAADSGIYLDGALGHDTLLGGEGDDLLRGGPGNDVLEGGEGSDTALFENAYANYSVGFLSDGRVFFDGTADDAILTDIDRAVFVDGTRLDLGTGEVSQGETPRTPAPEEIINSESIAEPQAGGEVAPASFDQAETADDALVASARLETLSRWSTGYVMAVEITNTSDASVEEPRISFDLPAEIKELYGASLISQESDMYTIASDNDILEPGSTLRFSFKTYAPESWMPEAMKLNGGGVEVDDSHLYTGGDSRSDLTSQTRVTSNITSEWAGGYTAEVFVENTS